MLETALLGGPALAHQREQMGESLLIGLPSLHHELFATLIQHQGHLV